MLQHCDDVQFLENLRNKLGSKVVSSTRQRPSIDTRSWSLPGFGGKSRVTTSFGELPIEALRLRDPVRTPSGKYLKVQWIDKLQLDAQFLSRHPRSNPIMIPKGSLDPQTPTNDVLVSPAQALRLPRHTSGGRATNADAMLGRNNIASRSQNGFTYYLFHCGEPTMVRVESVWFEVSPD